MVACLFQKDMRKPSQIGPTDTSLSELGMSLEGLANSITHIDYTMNKISKNVSLRVNGVTIATR